MKIYQTESVLSIVFVHFIYIIILFSAVIKAGHSMLNVLLTGPLFSFL